VRSGQLKNVSLMTRLRTMVDLPVGVLHCVQLLRGFKPQVVIGVGGMLRARDDGRRAASCADAGV